MRVEIDRKELKAALAGLARVVPRRVTLPVLNTVLIRADAAGVKLHGTDLEESISYHATGATVEAEGAACVPFKALSDVAKALRAATVTIEAGDTDGEGGIVVTLCGVPHYGISAAEYPALDSPAIETKPAGVDVCGIYRRLLPFASTDETRYAIRGVYLDPRGPVPCMVATDGRRLSVIDAPGLALDGPCIVPRSKFLERTKLGESRIGADERSVCIESGPWRYVARLVDAIYPNWRLVVPDPSANLVGVEFEAAGVDGFNEAAALLPNNPRCKNPVVLRCAGDVVTIGAGEITRDLDGVRATARFGGVGVDRGYFSEALSAGFRAWRIRDERSPLLADDGRGGRHVLMPMRVN